MKVLVLGAGKMVEAILVGLSKSEDLSSFYIYSPSGVSASKLAEKVGGNAVTDLSTVDSPDWILIGCKPQQLPELAQTLSGQFKDSLFVSILAAISEEVHLKVLNIKKLIRVMPNLPVAFNEGVTLISSESAVKHLSEFQITLSKLGTAVIVKESELEELTLLTGSGPAFFYEFTQLLAESFTSLNESQREYLARQVLIGAAKASSVSDKDLGSMVNDVTSKGGVTIAVLNKWRERDLKALITSGVEAGRKRTQELKELLRS
jgi:pyrroline-5-carboxylate reductase